MLIFTFANHPSPSANFWFWKCHRFFPHHHLDRKVFAQTISFIFQGLLILRRCHPKKAFWKKLLHSECTHHVGTKVVFKTGCASKKSVLARDLLGWVRCQLLNCLFNWTTLSGFCNMSYSEIYHQRSKQWPIAKQDNTNIIQHHLAYSAFGCRRCISKNIKIFPYQTKNHQNIFFQKQYSIYSLDVQKKILGLAGNLCVFFLSLSLCCCSPPSKQPLSFWPRDSPMEKMRTGGQARHWGLKIIHRDLDSFWLFFSLVKVEHHKVIGGLGATHEKNSFTVPIAGILGIILVECKPTNSKKQTLFLPMGGSFNHSTYQHLPTLWNPAIFTNGIVVIIRSTHKNAIIPPVGLLGLLLVYCQSWILGLVQKMATAIFDTPHIWEVSRSTANWIQL